MAVDTYRRAILATVVLTTRMSGFSTDTQMTDERLDAETTSEAVLSAVAAASGVDVMDLPPLFEAVDPDALDSLFQADTDSNRVPVGYVRFEYYGYEVIVDENNDVTLERKQ